jgi:hypothetical protein
MKVYELTNYPRIYVHTYWGAFSTGDHHTGNDEIIHNRNRFIREFNIKKSADRPKYIQKMLDKYKADKLDLDHIETYINHNNEYVILSSPYYPTETDQQKYSENGWISIYNLYMHEGTTTFMKTVPMRRRRPSFDESS